MISIYPRLVTSLQVKLAQFALLTHRAAVLAVLPTSSKSRATHWPTQPAPDLLKAVVHFAGYAGTPKVGLLLLRTWFQKKTELRAVVRHALYEAGYPVPPLAESEPRPWNVRLAPEDVCQQGNQYFFCPAGQDVANAADASREEVTLMAHLLGWSVLAAFVGETPPETPELHTAAHGYELLHTLEGVLFGLTAAMPADLAAQVRRGELPDAMALYWLADGWPAMRTILASTRATLQRALQEPESPDQVPLTMTELAGLVQRLEHRGVGNYLSQHHRLDAMAVLTRVAGLRHRQHVDFAPLATLRARADAVRATFEAEWPLDEAGQCTANLSGEQVQALLAQANVFILLLRLVDQPEELAQLDETSEDFLLLEAAVPPAVLNALLLRKLEAAG